MFNIVLNLGIIKRYLILMNNVHSNILVTFIRIKESLF